MAQNGLISVTSEHSARDTVERLIAALGKRKLTVFARVDHAAGAASVGLSLRPTEVVLFGNPQGGTAPRPKTISGSMRGSGKPASGSVAV